MTFASDVTRMAYHELPTDVQRYYLELEDRLAENGRTLQLDGVVRTSDALEIIIRVCEQA